MNYPADDTLDGGALHLIDEWLDGSIGTQYTGLAQDWARVSKICEEAGEAIAALIGATGQNPRKGQTHTMDDVLGELADACITGALAIQHFTKDHTVTRQIIRSKLLATERRAFEHAQKAATP